MTRNKLIAALWSRLSTEGKLNSRPDFGRLSRRGFILGSGAITAGTLYETGFSDTPRILRDGNGYLLEFGGACWKIDAEAWGRSAVLRYRSGMRSHDIILTGGRFPGTDFTPDFTGRIFKTAGEWIIRITLHQLQTSGEIPLADWMRVTPLTARNPSTRIRLGDTPVEIDSGAISLIP
ncbi:MAG: hypothetical protein KAH44_26445, partial [Oricola sp.]|nr:hypothetical protein [Oricola sp.]